MKGPLLAMVAFLTFFSGGLSVEQRPAAQPTEFTIGRLTFFDFGPPFDYYEIFIVRPNFDGTLIDRVTLTPAADSCFVPAKMEVASATIAEPVARLLANTNPCAIPEKELSRELKRCKKCLVFSGAKISMQVQCGNNSRIIRSDVLDRDMFDPAAKTPSNTEWTMRLLGRLDAAVGPGVMDKPMFATSDDSKTSRTLDSGVLDDIGSGKYDGLFANAEDKPSNLYQAATHAHPAVPTVELDSSTPYAPITFVPPAYPAISKLAKVSGRVSLSLLIDSNGHATNVLPATGTVLLRASAEAAASTWTFPKAANGQVVSVTLRYSLNCVPTSK